MIRIIKQKKNPQQSSGNKKLIRWNKQSAVQYLILFPPAFILKNISSHVWCINIHIHFERQKNLLFTPTFYHHLISLPFSSLPLISLSLTQVNVILVVDVAKNHPRISNIHINTSHTFSCSSFLVNSSCKQKIHVKLAVVCGLMQYSILFN